MTRPPTSKRVKPARDVAASATETAQVDSAREHLRRPVTTDESSLPPGRQRRPGGGRRRDPAIDARILESARRVYADKGWGGFTFDAVAQSAAVSRDAINRRHPDLRSLLHAAVVTEDAPVIRYVPTVGLREAITRSAFEIFDYFTVGAGSTLFRIHLEAHEFPAVYRAYRDGVVDPNFRSSQQAVKRLLGDAGMDPEAVDVPAFVEMVTGSILLHALRHQVAGDDPSEYRAARDAVANHVGLALSAIGAPTD